MYVTAPGIHSPFQFTPSAEGCVFFKLAPVLNCSRHRSGSFDRAWVLTSVPIYARFCRNSKASAPCTSGPSSFPELPHLELIHFSLYIIQSPQLTVLYILAEGLHCSNHLTSNIHDFFLALPSSRLAFLGIASWAYIRGSWGIAHLMYLIFLGAPGDFRV